jgi:hypothetical protein
VSSLGLRSASWYIFWRLCETELKLGTLRTDFIYILLGLMWTKSHIFVIYKQKIQNDVPHKLFKYNYWILITYLLFHGPFKREKLLHYKQECLILEYKLKDNRKRELVWKLSVPHWTKLYTAEENTLTFWSLWKKKSMKYMLHDAVPFITLWYDWENILIFLCVQPPIFYAICW